MKKHCEYCGSEFNAKRAIIRFCNRACSAKWRAENHPLQPTVFKKGCQAWNAGKNISGMSGKRHTEETKEKMRLSSLGDKASNWKGGVTEEHYRIRRSGKYAAWRKAVFERDGYTCVHCGAKSAAGKRVRIEADHILQFANHPEKRFDVDNGRTLCAPCHRKTDTWGKQVTLEQSGQKFNDMDIKGRIEDSADA